MEREKSAKSPDEGENGRQGARALQGQLQVAGMLDARQSCRATCLVLRERASSNQKDASRATRIANSQSAIVLDRQCRGWYNKRGTWRVSMRKRQRLSSPVLQQIEVCQSHSHPQARAELPCQACEWTYRAHSSQPRSRQAPPPE